MTENAPTVIDIGAETAMAPSEYLLIGVALAVAVAYLGRGFLRKRRRMASGAGCGTCPGCGASGACDRPPPFDVPPPGADKA